MARRGKSRVRAWAFVGATGLLSAGGVAAGSACAGKSKSTQSPMQCMQSCEQERCEYTPDGVGDNTAYLECLEGCEKKCAD